MVSQKKMYAYASVAIGGGGILLSLVGGPLGIVGALLSAIGTGLGAAFLSFGYLAIPALTKVTKISLVNTVENYEVPPSQDVIIKHAGDIYYATIFLNVEIYESPTAQTDEGISYSEFFERAISSLRYVTKVAYIMYVEDVSKKRQEIDTKRAESQLKLQRERDRGDPDPLKLDRLQRELEILDVQLGKLIKGIKPMGVIAYAMTTAAGVSKDAAVTAARAQAEQVRTAISNSLNVETKWLSGDEMLKCFEWEKFFPTSIQELEDSMS